MTAEADIAAIDPIGSIRTALTSVLARADSGGSGGLPEVLGYDVHDFGAVGNNVADDTQAITDAMLYAAGLGRNATVHFRGGKKYAVTDAIPWPRGVKLVGHRGGITGAFGQPAFRWAGPAGGTMLIVDASDNLYNTQAWGLGFAMDGSPGSIILEDPIVPGENWDTFSGFYDCALAAAETGVMIRNGPTQAHFIWTRFDQLRTSVNCASNNTSIITFDKIEFDNVNQTGGELLYLPTGHDGSFITVSIRDSRLEVNGTTDGIVTVDPHDTKDGHLRLLFSGLWCQGNGAWGTPWVNLTADRPLFVDATWINCSGQLSELYGGAAANIGANHFEQVTKIKDGVVTRL